MLSSAKTLNPKNETESPGAEEKLFQHKGTSQSWNEIPTRSDEN
jgi:hypothetical protein